MNGRFNFVIPSRNEKTNTENSQRAMVLPPLSSPSPYPSPSSSSSYSSASCAPSPSGLPSGSPSPTAIRHWVRRSALGSGSFGSVSLALDLDCGAPFAVKSSGGGPGQAAALENELRVLESLPPCPRIVRLLGAARAPSSPLSLFLEYIDGGSLSDLIRRSGGRLPERHVSFLALGILQGLSFLHQHEVVHGDIKSHNILLSSSSGVKIADFGASSAIAAPRFAGTPLWMAPEVVQGVSQGPPSDIWSFGCTVVEMLQGRPPWRFGHQQAALPASSSELAAILFKIGCTDEEAPLPECASPLARDFLEKCLQRDPKRRWTAAELLEHPFVKLAGAGEQDQCAGLVKGQAPSPRSTLDVYGSDWEESSTANTVPSLSLPKAELTLVASPSPSPSTEGKWITVRRLDEWCGGDRPQPFLEREGDVRKACEVSFECAAFLMKRRKTVG